MNTNAMENIAHVAIQCSQTQNNVTASDILRYGVPSSNGIFINKFLFLFCQWSK